MDIFENMARQSWKAKGSAWIPQTLKHSCLKIYKKTSVSTPINPAPRRVRGGNRQNSEYLCLKMLLCLKLTDKDRKKLRLYQTSRSWMQPWCSHTHQNAYSCNMAELTSYGWVSSLSEYKGTDPNHWTWVYSIASSSHPDPGSDGRKGSPDQGCGTVFLEPIKRVVVSVYVKCQSEYLSPCIFKSVILTTPQRTQWVNLLSFVF